MDFTISNQERIDLKRLISQTECEDNTENIRKLKHSSRILNDVSKLVKFKKDNITLYNDKPEEFDLEAQTVANFLYVHYTDIYRRLIKDEINLAILAKFLHILKGIEDGKVDQHEASVLVGRVLKELYLDSAVRHGENLDKMYSSQEPEPEPKNKGKEISWKDFKSK